MSLKNVRLNRLNIANICSRFKVLAMQLKSGIGSIIVASLALSSAGVTADMLSFSDVSSGYSDCRFYDGGSTYEIELTVNFKSASGRIGSAEFFRARGVMLYTYNADGVMNSFDAAQSVAINNYKGRDHFYANSTFGEHYDLYWDYGCAYNVWCTSNAFAAKVRILVPKSSIAGWPAIAVRAANVGSVSGGVKSTDHIGDIQGVAYLSPNTKNGQCEILNSPVNPPLPVTPNITMTAPDWDLGELPRGEETELTLPATKDQLCFSYEGSTALSNQKFLINATNIHGVSGDGRYLLKSLLDSSQTVPYTLTLANSKDSVLLPNTQSRLFSLDTGGRTCFTPTFKAQPDPTVKAGAYSDILTFTVVVKP